MPQIYVWMCMYTYLNHCDSLDYKSENSKCTYFVIHYIKCSRIPDLFLMKCYCGSGLHSQKTLMVMKTITYLLNWYSLGEPESSTFITFGKKSQAQVTNKEKKHCLSLLGLFLGIVVAFTYTCKCQTIAQNISNYSSSLNCIFSWNFC